jgi:hypothetical protein
LRSFGRHGWQNWGRHDRRLPLFTEDFPYLFWQSYQRFEIVSFFKGDSYLGDLRVIDTKRIADKVNKFPNDCYIPLTLLSAVRAEHWLRLVNTEPRIGTSQNTDAMEI